MFTFFLGQNKEEIEKAILGIIQEIGTVRLGIEKQHGMLKIFKGQELIEMISLEEKIRELAGGLLLERKGKIYRAVLERVERSLLEYLLEYSGGNKVKTAKILGINRNTLDTKIKRLGIAVLKYKV